MCSSQRPENGADSELVERADPRDSTCDYCGRMVFGGGIRPVSIGTSISWLCDACHDRQEQQYQEMTALDGIDVAAKERAA